MSSPTFLSSATRSVLMPPKKLSETPAASGCLSRAPPHTWGAYQILGSGRWGSPGGMARRGQHGADRSHRSPFLLVGAGLAAAGLVPIPDGGYGGATSIPPRAGHHRARASSLHHEPGESR